MPNAYKIVVRVKSRKLDLYRQSKLYKTYPVAVGKPLTPTPRGNFRIINKSKNPGGAFGTRWMGLSKPHIGIHGTNKPSLIGKSVSKGCIRMHNKDVEELYDLVEIATPVRIVNE
jgi:lipoprotein-anchoring transpeptidase ErfK/SrfK